MYFTFPTLKQIKTKCIWRVYAVDLKVKAQYQIAENGNLLNNQGGLCFQFDNTVCNHSSEPEEYAMNL